jgi:hypothetical protein
MSVGFALERWMVGGSLSSVFFCTNWRTVAILFVIILYSGHDKLPTPLSSGAKHQPDEENPAIVVVY